MSKQKTDNVGTGSGQTLPLENNRILAKIPPADLPHDPAIPPPAEPTPVKAKPRRPSTALQAAAHVERILDALEGQERQRVMMWLLDRYKSALQDYVAGWLKITERADPCP